MFILSTELLSSEEIDYCFDQCIAEYQEVFYWTQRIFLFCVGLPQAAVHLFLSQIKKSEDAFLKNVFLPLRFLLVQSVSTSYLSL